MKKVKRKKYTLNKIIAIISILLIPFFVALKIVELNHNTLFSPEFLAIKEIVLYSLIGLFVINVFILIKNKCIKSDKKMVAIVALFFLSIALELAGSLKLIYYNDSFKEWVITTSIGSINYKHVATNLYNYKTIDNVMDKEATKLSESYNDDIVKYDDLEVSNVHYRNEEEEAILAHEEGEDYKIIKIEGTTIGADYHYEGYLAILYDPSKVKLAKSSGAGTDEATSYGETLATISRKNNARVAINGGGFYDPDWSSNGGIPHGVTIIDGKVDTEYYSGIESGGLIGFNKDNKMVLKRMGAQEAIDAGIRDAVEWGPYLIENGHNNYQNVTWYSWACARTAIGQRADGIVLFLVIDGLQNHSQGAGYADIAAIMQKYGAVNAASVDGGTSTSMTVNHEYINKPWNGYQPTFRWFPNAWIYE